jgi:hypothetical protein
LELKELAGLHVNGDAGTSAMSYEQFAHNSISGSLKHFMETPDQDIHVKKKKKKKNIK